MSLRDAYLASSRESARRRAAARDEFLEGMVREGLYPASARHLRFYLDFLFEGIEIANRSVLDVGGGSGLYSLYASHSGAARVVCLEPGLDGSTAGAELHLQRLAREWSISNIVLSRASLQEFDPDGEPFDCLLLHESVNHLDEPSCVNLLRSATAWGTYRKLFDRLARCGRPGSTLILCDCSRYNFFPLIGRTNPLMPMIEWHKHHTPRLWIKLLTESGFQNPRVRWTPTFRRLGRLGRFFLSNEAMSFFLTSRFRLTMSKK